ncbi:MAG: PAC2 family protein [Thermoproteota archaeon]
MRRVLSRRGIEVYLKEGVEDYDLFVTGFKGFGAVGYIASLHIVEALSCPIAGYIFTRYTPELATPDHSGGIAGPFVLYACSSEGARMLVLVNHDLPAPQERTRFAHAVVGLAKKLGVREAVFIGGFDARFREGEEPLRWLATSGYSRKVDAPRMSRGLYVIGPLALLLLAAEAEKYPAAAILPYAEAERPDPRAAAVAVDQINKIYGTDIPVVPLLEEARKIEEMVIEMERRQREAMSPSADRAYM